MKKKSTYPWAVVALLWMVALFNYMDRQMLSTMRPSISHDIPALTSATNFGYLMAVFLWVYGCISPFAGMVADRVNRKWLIVASLFVWSAVTFFMGYARTFEQLYWLRALMGLSEALYIPAALSLIADYHTDRTRSLAVGIHMSGLYLGQALGGFGATVADVFSWQHTFRSFGLAGLIYACVLIIFLKEKRVPTDKNGIVETHRRFDFIRGLQSLFRNAAFWIILLYFAVPSLSGWGIKNWLPTLFSENLHIGMEKAGPYATIAIAVSSLLGVIFGGTLSDRWVQKNNRGRIYTSAIGLALTIPALCFIGLGHSLFSMFAGAWCFGFGYGMFDANNLPILCQFVSSRYRATAYGIMNMAGVFAGAFITNVLGSSSEAGNLGRSFIYLGIIVLVALFLQLYFLKNPKTTLS